MPVLVYIPGSLRLQATLGGSLGGRPINASTMPARMLCTICFNHGKRMQQIMQPNSQISHISSLCRMLVRLVRIEGCAIDGVQQH